MRPIDSKDPAKGVHPAAVTPSPLQKVKGETLTQLTRARVFGETVRIRRMHLPSRASRIGMTVRAADQSLHLKGGGEGLIDATPLDTVCFLPPEWAQAILARAGGSMCNAVKVNVFLKLGADVAVFNAIYERYFLGRIRPGRQPLRISRWARGSWM